LQLEWQSLEDVMTYVIVLVIWVAKFNGSIEFVLSQEFHTPQQCMEFARTIMPELAAKHNSPMVWKCGYKKIEVVQGEPQGSLTLSEPHPTLL
jgi:hypothetical protein